MMSDQSSRHIIAAAAAVIEAGCKGNIIESGWTNQREENINFPLFLCRYP